MSERIAEHVIKRYEELIQAGEDLVPQGGFDFSGYNARLQQRFLEWRNACLEIIELSGPIGYAHKIRIVRDLKGELFYQTSANLILTQLKELHEKIQAVPELSEAPPSKDVSEPSVAAADSRQTRTVPPPSDEVQKVYVIGESDDPLKIQLENFLSEIGIDEISVNRQRGTMLDLDTIEEQTNARYAFFILSEKDFGYVMFELGHFVGKLGKGNVCVLHMTDVPFPPNVPGVTDESIVVKLEEVSLVLIKELKSRGYQIRL